MHPRPTTPTSGPVLPNVVYRTRPCPLRPLRPCAGEADRERAGRRTHRASRPRGLRARSLSLTPLGPATDGSVSRRCETAPCRGRVPAVPGSCRRALDVPSDDVLRPVGVAPAVGPFGGVVRAAGEDRGQALGARRGAARPPMARLAGLRGVGRAPWTGRGTAVESGPGGRACSAERSEGGTGPWNGETERGAAGDRRGTERHRRPGHCSSFSPPRTSSSTTPRPP